MMHRLRSSLIVSALCLAIATADSVESQMKGLIDFLRSRGGMFNAKLEIRRVDENDSRIGIFTTKDIKDQELLLQIPPSALFVPSEEELKDKVDYDCETTHMLIREMKLGDKSEYAPYINYLLTQSYGQLPSVWSYQGKDLLKSVLYDYDEQKIPPTGPFSRAMEWTGDCKGNNDPFEINAYMLLVQRGWDHNLIPVLDMMSHRNGKWLNTDSNSLTEGELNVRATRSIKAGEELYMSYNFCKDCGARLTEYGTPQILRDYGFVEQYPQRWVFIEEDVWFDIDMEEFGNDVYYNITFYEGEPDDLELAVTFLEEQLERLHDLVLDGTGVPDHEFEITKQFQDSAIFAMTKAYQYLTDDDEGCQIGEACYLKKYDMLDVEVDKFVYNKPICDMDKIFKFETYDHNYETINSPYHSLVYFRDENTKDTCFELDAIVQMCGCYRPHYHEMVVHFTARYLDNIKRVVFVGGGDSMLLHEILKYPSLELVLGLELDQKVTRSAFKHFGCQPHWNNEKVQWWYGDATKSLLMLPKDYFGSFDLVLVDLSETVMSFLVTEGLDVMEALSLLLKQDGIFVKNEHYLDDLSGIFDYTIQLHYDCPIICHQNLVLGSNKIDFLYREKKDHHVDILLDKLDIDKPRYDIIHDYRFNRTSVQKHCKPKDSPVSEEEPTTQKRSPGIIMILETENTVIDLTNANEVQSHIEAAVKSQGLSVISSVKSTPGDSKVMVVTITSDGYIVTRTWPEHKYCAFDIHLWSNFDKHENIKKSLISAIGSDNASSSSYRIVAGGMFGVSTWKSDEKSRGPRVNQFCDDIGMSAGDAASEESVVDIILEESLKMSRASDIMVAVICGPETQACSGIDVAKKNKNTHEVVALWTCPEIVGASEYDEGMMERMTICEESLYGQMSKAVGGNKNFDAVILDPSASLPMGQILLKIFKRHKRELFAEAMLLVTTVLNETEVWKRILVHRFRQVIKWEPVFRTEVLVNSTDGIIELDLISSGDWLFFEHLVDVRASIDKRSGLVSEVLNIQGGLWKYNPNYKPSQWFLPRDYDQKEPLKQWASQQPLGHQNVFQLKPMKKKEGAKISIALIRHALIYAITSMKYDLESKVESHEFGDIGDGYVFLEFWSGGNIVLLWDGREHIDINLFTYVEDVEAAKQFAEHFNKEIDITEVTLHDDQPRGYGGVVNFLSDVEPRGDPQWLDS